MLKISQHEETSSKKFCVDLASAKYSGINSSSSVDPFIFEVTFLFLLDILLSAIRPPATHVMITTEKKFQYRLLTFILLSILLSRGWFFKCLSYDRMPPLFLVFQLYIWKFEVCNLPVAS